MRRLSSVLPWNLTCCETVTLPPYKRRLMPGYDRRRQKCMHIVLSVENLVSLSHTTQITGQCTSGAVSELGRRRVVWLARSLGHGGCGVAADLPQHLNCVHVSMFLIPSPSPEPARNIGQHGQPQKGGNAGWDVTGCCLVCRR